VCSSTASHTSEIGARGVHHCYHWYGSYLYGSCMLFDSTPLSVQAVKRKQIGVYKKSWTTILNHQAASWSQPATSVTSSSSPSPRASFLRHEVHTLHHPRPHSRPRNRGPGTPRPARAPRRPHDRRRKDAALRPQSSRTGPADGLLARSVPALDLAGRQVQHAQGRPRARRHKRRPGRVVLCDLRELVQPVRRRDVDRRKRSRH
jgi:hypothetical protein